MVDAGRAFAAPLGVDSIVGLGGGSSLDCAKGINFLLTNGGTMADYRGYGKATTPLLPMIGVPTTAGTGSEAQSYAVIADAATHMKMACGDPSRGVPDRASRSRADADRAARRSPRWPGSTPSRTPSRPAVTTRRTPLSDTFSQRAWELLTRSVRARAGAARTTSRRAAAMLLGAHFAGMAIEQSMLGAAHACANPLTARYDLAARPRAVDPAAARRPLERVGGGERYAAARRTLGSNVRRRRSPHRLERLRASRRPGRRAPRPRRASRRAPGLAELAATAVDRRRSTRGRSMPAGALEIYRAAH